jgi:predicted acetyltransferase
MTGLRLVSPCREYALSFAEALREGMETYPWPEEKIRQLETDFDCWLRDKNDLSIPFILSDGSHVRRVPSTELWLVSGPRVLGRINVRHELSEFLKTIGGHIGYAVRPSERKKGYATYMLKNAVVVAKNLGIEKALLTCDDSNMASRKVIESAGGVLEGTIEHNGDLKRRYWITL